MLDADYYETLQVSPDADAEVIRAAYRVLSKKYHPDLHGADASIERMKLLNRAHDVLSDPEMRRTYDRQRDHRTRVSGVQEVTQQPQSRAKSKNDSRARKPSDGKKQQATAEQVRREAEDRLRRAKEAAEQERRRREAEYAAKQAAEQERRRREAEYAAKQAAEQERWRQEVEELAKREAAAKAHACNMARRKIISSERTQFVVLWVLLLCVDMQANHLMYQAVPLWRIVYIYYFVTLALKLIFVYLVARLALLLESKRGLVLFFIALAALDIGLLLLGPIILWRASRQTEEFPNAINSQPAKWVRNVCGVIAITAGLLVGYVWLVWVPYFASSASSWLWLPASFFALPLAMSIDGDLYSAEVFHVWYVMMVGIVSLIALSSSVRRQRSIGAAWKANM